jgi:2-polyprenyl-3-methyl-5-hydroxy-6-metoxy-1,4-benzoquinol methylase
MKESEIRPRELFNKYLELAQKDVETYFSNCEYSERKCPACADDGSFNFKKKGFDYHLCSQCDTLYVNPLPEDAAFINYYSESPSTRFWATDFFKHTEEARREKIFIPRVNLVREIISRYSDDFKNLVDIGAGYGTFAQEIKKRDRLNVYTIEPNKDLGEVLQKKGLELIPKFIQDVSREDLPIGKSCFTCFELVEHLCDPRAFFESLLRLMKKDDIVIFTTLNCMGLDIMVLWDESKAIHPPHHIVFFNPKSIRILLENIGYKILEIKTPGKLDVDILSNNRSKIKDRFWKHFIDNSSEEQRELMQDFIEKNCLSSHMMVIAQK